ncbi:Tubulin-folding cofactor B [Exaiptasia diaphana]|nr:Tubulin-folding cofactor B [Exaiptasia diaphana]
MATVITPHLVTVQISNNVTSFMSEKRFEKGITIAALKGKLELITGCPASSVDLQLFDKESNLIGPMNDDDALFGSYPVEDNMRIHVIDRDPKKIAGEFEDLSKVEKYEISEDDYSKKTDSVRAFKMRNKLGRFAETTAEDEEQKKAKEKREQEEAEAIPVGSRCEIRIGGNAKRGEVMFVGKTDFKPGYWVGVKYDEPLGKNDGSVAGKRYFTCINKYGGFVRPKDVVVGDFPEEDLGIASDEEM